MAAHGEKTATRAKAGDMSSGADGGERSMRCALGVESSVEDTASGARRQKAMWCATPCAEERDWDEESRPQSDASSRVGMWNRVRIDGQSEQNTARLRQRPISRSSVCPVLAESFQ